MFRREFLKSLSAIVISIPLASAMSSALARAQDKKSAAKKDVPLPDGQKPVPDNDPVAQAIGYKPNIKDIDYTRYPQRKKPDAKDQFCHNCSLYTKVNDGWGRCQLMQAGLVSEHGWCGSWSKKV